MASSDSNQNVLDLIAEEFLARFRRGERPAIGEYEARYPEHAEMIRDILPALVLMEQMKPASDEIAPPTPLDHAARVDILGQLGDYRIVREIGRGGMGIVYEAIQESLGRQVALKVLPRQQGGDSVRRERFEREARAAARLHHTNIVPVFGVGDADGLHFYAMQYIHGVGLDEVLEEVRRQRVPSAPQVIPGTEIGGAPRTRDELQSAERRAVSASMTEALLTGCLGPTEPAAGDSRRTTRVGDVSRDDGSPTIRHAHDRLSSSSVSWPDGSDSAGRSFGRGMYCKNIARIGVQVGEALQYAHEQGVLHRDIKPSNLLLDTRGAVWVTDFGLAKAHNTPELTRTGDVLGTLRYLAPEAFSGQTDRRGDIYALGLTLYEMLALRPAFDEKDRARLIRLIANESPPHLRTLAPSVPRDLEMVIHKAIDREPRQRYASAQQFVEDLQRFLRDEPVEARRTSAARRLVQWCNRNRMVASLAVVASLLLVLVTAGAIVMAIHLNTVLADRGTALERARRARETAAQEKTAADQARESADRAQRQERNLRQEAERHRDRAIVNFDRARRTVDRYLSQITDKQLLAVPGLQPLRQELLVEALEFYGEFTREQEGGPEIQIELAKAQHRLSMILREVGNSAGSQAANREAIRQLETLRDSQVGGNDVSQALAEAYGIASRFDDAVAVCERLLQQTPDLVSVRSTLAETYNSMALQSKPPRSVAEALELHQKAFAIRRRLVEEFPESGEFNAELAATMNNIGVLLAGQDQTREALSMYELATTYSKRACELAPHVVLWGRWHAQGEHNVGATLRKLGRSSQAIEHFQTNVAIRRRLAQQNPAVEQLHKELYRDLVQLADRQKEAGKSEESSQTYREALEALTQMPRATADDHFQLAVVHAELVARSQGNNDTIDEGVAELVGGPSAAAAIRALDSAVRLGWADQERLKSTAVMKSLRNHDRFLQLEAQIAAIAQANQLVAADASSTDERLGNQQKAIQVLERFVVQSQENQQARKILATKLLELGAQQIPAKQYDEAEQNLKRAVELFTPLHRQDVNDNNVQGNLGSTLVALGEVAWKKQQVEVSRERWNAGLEHLHTVFVRLPESSESRGLVMARIRRVYELYGEAGLWDLACGFVERELPEVALQDSIWAAKFSYVLAATGRLDEHARLARVLAGKWTVESADRAIWSAQMNSEPLLLSADLTRMADKAFPKTQDPLAQFRLASAYFQAGEPARAYSRMRELLSQAEERGGSAYLHLYATVCHALGKVEECETYFQKGEDKYRLLVTKCLESPVEGAVALSRGGHWYALAEDRVLREQAWRWIRKQRTPPDPWWHVLQGRAHSFVGDRARADQEFAAAVAAAPRNGDVQLAVVRALNETAAPESSVEAHWDKVVEFAGSNPRPWIERGRRYAERGQRTKAEADYASAAALTPGELNKFLEAGWWVVGPYPIELREFCPPELEADPAKSVKVVDPKLGLSPTPLAWQHVDAGDFGRVDLGKFAGGAGNASFYALTHVYAPHDMTTTLCLSATKNARVWINGDLRYDFDPKVVENTWSRDPCRMPIALRAGLNTILIKSFPDSQLTVRLGDHPYDQGLELARYGYWKEAADRLEEGLRRSNEVFLHEYPFRSLAAYRVAAGDIEAARKLYEELSEQHRDTKTPFWNFAIAQIGCLAPGIAVDETLLLRRAEAVRGESNPTLRIVLPMAYARQGRWQDVVDYLAQDEACRTQTAEAASLLAMAYHHLGRTTEARALLAQAMSIDHALPEWTGRVPISGAISALILPREACVAVTGSADAVNQHVTAFFQKRRDLRERSRRETFDFDTAVQIHPQHAWLRVARGWRRLEVGAPLPAGAEFDKAVELAPRNRHVASERAAFLAETASKERAADEFWRALHIPFAGHEDWNVAGRTVEARLMEYDEVLEELLCRHPESSELHRLHGERSARLGRWRESLNSFATGAPYWSHALFAAYMAVLLDEPEVHARERNRAREMIQQEFASRPDWRVTFEALVVCANVVSKEEGARWVKQVQEVAKTEAMAAETRLALSLAEYRAGFHEAALNDATAAVAPAHRWQIDAMSWPLRAMAHWQLGQHDQARNCLQRGFEHLDLIRRAAHERGLIGGPSASEGYWMVALVLYREAKSLLDGPAAADEAALNLCRGDDGLKSPRQARADRIRSWLDAALEQTPTDPLLWLRSAKWHAIRGETRRASEDYSQALRLSPDDPVVLKAHATFLASLGRTSESRLSFTRAHGQPSDHPVGMLLDVLVRHDVARRWHCAEPNPGWPELQQCELAQRDGVFVVNTTGDQPFLSCDWATPAGEKEWWVCARIEGESLDAALSWATAQAPTYSRERSARFRMEAQSGTWRVHRVRFQSDQDIRSFRFAPANRAGAKLEIAWVALINR